jgi:hypothetical protein
MFQGFALGLAGVNLAPQVLRASIVGIRIEGCLTPVMPIELWHPALDAVVAS